MIDYLQEENRVLRARLRGKRLRLSDDDRRRLAVKAQALGREALAQIASVATPDTLVHYSHESDVLRTRLRPGRNPARCRRRATDAYSARHAKTLSIGLRI